MKCPSCGFDNPAAARFCGGCGKPIETGGAAVREAERRHLCVLFCDLVGSTLLSQRLDAEDLRELVAAYQQACAKVVQRHDGFVAQYLGDGILVYFGYPHAHEDDASRVVRCGLEMVEAVRQLAPAEGYDLKVRIGIHSGRVVVGTVGPDRFGRIAVGDVPNIADRIQSEAAPGEVIISDALRRLLPGTFAVEPMGIRAPKGIQQPIQLFKVVESGGQAAGLNAPRTPFIGRTSERQRTRQIWDRAKSGPAQYALLRGEPGIGKSRLIEVIRGELEDDITDVLVARCTPFTTDTAFHPVVELLGARLGIAGSSAEEQVDRIATRMSDLGIMSQDVVPLLASVLSIPVDPAVWPMPDISPVRARQRLMDILIEAVQATAHRGAVVLIVEDLHWADPSTVELLRQLIALPQSASLMALLTARPEFKPTWAGATNVTEIELEALDLAEAETFIRKVARDKPLPPEVAWRIRERANGNPLFLEEITRSVMESDALVEREHSWELVGTLSADPVPISIEASLMARMERLGEARALLQLGATLGREFSHDLLVAVALAPQETFTHYLEVMLASGLVFRHGVASTVYCFKHALVCDAAYDSLLRATRQRYHARIAEVLIEKFPEVTQNQPELFAHHLSGARSHRKAATHWRIAGENAAKRSAVNEAIAHLRRALADLALLNSDTERLNDELSVLAALAPALMAVYGWAAPEVAETCRRAIVLADQLGAPDRMYGPLWGLWTNQFIGGRLGEAMTTATQVLTMALASGSPMLEITGYHATSYTRYYRGEYADAIAQAEAGLRHYSLELEAVLALTFQLSSSICCMTARASSLWMQGRQDEGIALMDEMLAVARSLRHPPSLAAGLAFQMFFSLYDRDWQRLFAHADEAYALSRAEGFAMWTANAGLHRGRARMGLGELDAGVAEVLEWGSLFRQTGSGILEGSTTSMVSEALHVAGRSLEALVLSCEGEQRAVAGDVHVMEPEIYRTRGLILRDLNRLDEAEDAYRRAVVCARSQGAHSLELRALTFLLDLQISRGEARDSSAQLRRAMAAMACHPDRPDLAAARALLACVPPKSI